jgi:S1-C subfamily serine protease
MSAMTDLSSALAEAAAASAPGVVAVHGGRCDTTSGVAWSAEHVVTAAHALERENDLELTLGDERIPATLLGVDPGTDLAVLRVERSLTPLRHADEAALRFGSLVLAVSRNARGSRARLGILSRVGGPFRLGGGTRVEQYLESDIAPTPGLAGSALVDAAGALVGVNATGLVRGALVTLPASAVTRVVDAIVAHGHVRRAKLGVALQPVELPASVAERREKERGLIVLGVAPGGPAEHAGVLVGDVILGVAGTAVTRIDELQSVLDESKIGVDVVLELLRAGVETSLTLKPEAR